MSKENIGSGWQCIYDLERNVQEFEEEILELIATSPFDSKKFRELKVLIEVQESLFNHMFMFSVCWDLDLIIEMVDRDLLDRDGQ